MLKNIGILVIGSELLDGRVLDTNSKWLSKELHKLNIEVSGIVTVTDDIYDIEEALRFFTKKNVAGIIITGGLGPTTDDLTRDAVSKFLGVELFEDPEVINDLKKLFENRGRVFNASNALQAKRPKGSSLIKNPTGTAPGFIAKYPYKTGGFCSIYTLPGIPSELQIMFKESIVSDLINLGLCEKQSEAIFKIFGIPESNLNEEIKKLKIPDTIQVIYSVSYPILTFILRSSNEELVRKYEYEVHKLIGNEYIFSRDIDDTLPNTIVKILKEKKQTLSLAESCTGGLIGSLLTNISGSSEVFEGGVISYSNAVKASILAVKNESLDQYGAVSREVAKEMAEGVRLKLNADYGISVTGIAGPTGGSIEKPVGTVFIGISSKNDTVVNEYHFKFDRERVRVLSAHTAINNLRLMIQANNE
jgi:nicotinamide-nucleotide amidase